MARKKPVITDLTQQSVALAEYAAKALAAAEQLRIKTKDVEGFPLNETERVAVANLAAVKATLKKSWRKRTLPSQWPTLPTS